MPLALLLLLPLATVENALSAPSPLRMRAFAFSLWTWRPFLAQVHKQLRLQKS
jgi:hypothetical protein